MVKLLVEARASLSNVSGVHVSKLKSFCLFVCLFFFSFLIWGSILPQLSGMNFVQQYSKNLPYCL